MIWIPKSFSLDAMKAVIDLLHYWKSLLLTTEITVFSTLCSLVSCSMIGYGLARYRFKERGLVFALVVLTIVIPPQAVATSSFLNFRFFEQTLESLIGTKVSILNTPLTFILPSVFGCGLRAGLFIFIFRQFFKGIPKELEEASRIDGCGAFKTYMRIMVPMAKPAFITVCLYSVVWHWNDLYTSTMYFTSEIRPITPSLADLRDIMSTSGVLNNIGSELVVRSYFAAGAFLAAVPLLILFIVMQRHFTESIDNVGIVG
ncbi:MAG: carbohydrate ABC transporter permease [Acutalibacteraceae bacterium]